MSTLVLRAGTFKGPRLEKAVLAGGGRVSKCAPPGPADAAAWAVRWAKSQHSATLTPDGARALIEALGTDMGRIDTELAKLAVAAQARGGGRAAIDAALVAELSADTHEQRLWSIQAALLSGDPARALGELNHMIDVLRENPVGIGLAYLDLARKLDSAARGLAARESRPSIIGRLRLWGETVNPLLDAAAACGPAVTTPLLAAAVETDARSKSGGGDPRRLLEALTLRFTSLRR
jgi:DNA polymerase III delta subunit